MIFHRLCRGIIPLLCFIAAAAQAADTFRIPGY